MSAKSAAPSRERRSLSHVGGAVRLEGDRDAAERLAWAMDVPPSVEAEDLARAHVHGFHSYPARMHPLTARRLVEAFSRPGELVLDPFAGSGTVLVEARLGGRAAFGVDANPLAVRLARFKIAAWSARDRASWTLGAREVRAFADARRKARAGATHRYGQDDVDAFAPHTLLELDGIRAAILRDRDLERRAVLELVLSAILVKLSRRASDTAEGVAEKRIAAGYPARLFEKKTEELAARAAETSRGFAEALAIEAWAVEGDARRLPLPRDLEGRVRVVVSSPPYPGNYDYLAHHALRLRWLGLREDTFDRTEIGARRHLDPLGARGAIAAWEADLAAVLAGLRRAVEPDGEVVLLLADSVVAGAPVFAVDAFERIAPASGFALRAVASQERPYFHAATARAFGPRPRAEHALLLGPSR